MSKSRTGRKGRVRLALAGALGDIDTAVGDATIVDANGRLGASSGFLSSDDDLSNAQLLDYIQSQLNKTGTANAHFQQGEVRGPLANAIDTQNGATGAITRAAAAGAGTFAAATGEVDLAALAPLNTSPSGEFAHYALQNCSESDTLVKAITASAGGAITTATESVSTGQLASTALRGICYHHGGPGSDFVPLQQMGAAAADHIAASQIVINPSMETIWADTGVTAPTKIRIELHGDLISASNGDSAGQNGDTLSVYYTANTAAKAGVTFRTLGAGDTANGFGMGHQLVIRDENGDAICTVEGQNNAHSGSALVAADVGAAGAITGAKAGNYDAVTDAASKKVYVTAYTGTGGNGLTAYSGAGGSARAGGAGQFTAVVAAAIQALSDSQGLGLVVKTGVEASTASYPTPAGVNDANQLIIFYNKQRGTLGNKSHASNSGAASGANAVAGSLLTVTGYSESGQVLVPTAASHVWLGDTFNTSAVGAGNATSGVEFASGANDGGGNFACTGGSATTDDGAVAATQVEVNIQDLPVRVVYHSDDAAREGVGADGIPNDKSAGFVVVWGPVA